MIKEIVELLSVDDYIGVDPLVDFAKGSHKAPESLKEGYKQFKRNINGRQ